MGHTLLETGNPASNRWVQWLLALMFSICLSAAASAGLKEEIQADMQAARWMQADAKLDTVIKKHPDNALAYYWRAEVKVKLGDIEGARTALAQAKRLDPELTFAGNKNTLTKLERIIARGNDTVQVHSGLDEPRAAPPARLDRPVAPMPAQQATGSAGHFPWGTVIVIGFFLFAIWVWRKVSANARQNAHLRGPVGPVNYGAQPGWGGGPVGGGRGLGVGGVLAGVAGGVLLSEVLHSGSHASESNGPSYAPVSDDRDFSIDTGGSGGNWDSGDGGGDFGGSGGSFD